MWFFSFILSSLVSLIAFLPISPVYAESWVGINAGDGELAEEETDLPSDKVLLNMSDENSFANISQRLLNLITGLNCRSAHFYFLVDVSGSTKANDVADQFNRFYRYALDSFLYAGDTITYIPFARHPEWDMEETFEYDIQKRIEISPGSLTDETGTDWLEPIYLLLRRVEEQDLKEQEPIIIFHLSDRASEDDPRPDGYLYNDYYPKVDPEGMNGFLRLEEMLHKDSHVIQFAPGVLTLGQKEAFYLTVWYADNIGDFPINAKLNRERETEGQDVMLQAIATNKEVTFRMRAKSGAKGYVLYIGETLDGIYEAYKGNYGGGVRRFENIDYKDSAKDPAIKEYVMQNGEILNLFNDADKNSLFYSIREIDERTGESQLPGVRELPPITADVDAAPILLISGILMFAAAVALMWQRPKTTLKINGRPRTLIAGKNVDLLCKRDTERAGQHVLDVYPNAFNGLTVGRLAMSPSVPIPLFKLKVRFSSVRGGADIGAARYLNEGKNNITARVGSDSGGSAMEMEIIQKDLVKRNMPKLLMFGILLVLALVFLVMASVLAG
ncbi:MAG: hypothetical protein LBL96_07025 [Clostridiales bacterium]|nr:hypothetical protein [Clostridiales bacterium]